MKPALLLLLVPTLAHADVFLFQRAGGVWQKDGREEQLVAVDETREVRWMEPTRNGKLVVLDLGGGAAWLVADDAGGRPQLRAGPCTGRARPSPGAECVICPGPDGPTLVSTNRDVSLPLPGPLEDPAFLGVSGYDVAGLTAEGVVGLDRRRPADRRALTRPGATSHLVVAPDGMRAAAVFGDKETARVRSFLLDGEGVARQLGGPGVPTLFSWDSEWVMFQEGDIVNAPAPGDEESAVGADDRFLLAAPKKKSGKKKAAPRDTVPFTRVCVARAVGGEVKCWDGYVGQAFAPDSTAVLLRKGKALYVGKIAGVRPDPPAKVVDNVDGAGTWLPSPLMVTP